MAMGKQTRLKAVMIAAFAIVACAAVTYLSVQLARPKLTKAHGTASTGTSELNMSEKWDSDFSDFLICGLDNTSRLTDVIMIVGFNNVTHKVNIMQIPRDTYAGKNVVSHKYNAIYNHAPKTQNGMEVLKAHVEKDFGIKIRNYAVMTTDGLRHIVDAVGGVDIDVPINMNYDDKVQGLHIHLHRGKQHLDGSGVEQFVRYRKGWKNGDGGRLAAQQIFLAAFAKKLKSMSLLTLTTKVLPVMKQPYFDTNMNLYDMVKLGSAVKGVSLNDITVYTMPGEFYISKGIYFYSPYKSELLKILNKAFVPQGITLMQGNIGISQNVKTPGTSSNENGSNMQNIIDKQNQS